MKNTQVNPIFSWDEETGIASCILYNKANNKTYLGIAQCHTDDFDMMNEKTGCNIAFLRAKIKAFQSYKNDELTPALSALKQLYFSMNRSKKFNPNSYETKMLLNQIKIKEEDISEVKSIINNLKKDLKDMIDEKESFYQKVRKNRKKGDIID